MEIHLLGIRTRRGTSPSRYYTDNVLRYISRYIGWLLVIDFSLLMIYTFRPLDNADKDKWMAERGIPKLIRKLIMWPRIRVSVHLRAYLV